MTKLEQLCEIEGLTVEELVKSGTFDGTCYGYAKSRRGSTIVQ